MKRLAPAGGWAVASALLATAVPAVAQAPARPPAPPLFDLFESVCLQTRGDIDRVQAAPELRAWSRFPIPVPIPASKFKVRRKLVMGEGYAEKKTAILLAAQGDFNLGGRTAPGRICSVYLKGAEDPARTLRAAQTWAGLPGVTSGKKTSFRFQEVGGRRVPVGAGRMAEVAARLGSGPVIEVDATPEQDRTMLVYTLINL